MGGNSHDEINVFLQCMLSTIIGTPRNSYEENISEVYSYSYLPFLAHQGDYKHEIPISTIRAILKKFQSTKDVINLPGRGRVSVSS